MTTATNFNSWWTAQSALQRTVDTELQRGQSTDHDQTSRQPSKGAKEPQLLGQLGQQPDGGLAWGLLGLVDLGQQGVCRLRDDSGGQTSSQTGKQVQQGGGGGGHFVLWTGESVVELGGTFEDQEFSNVVRDLFEKNWCEPAVEGAHTFFFQDSGKPADQPVGKLGLRDQSDSGGL